MQLLSPVPMLAAAHLAAVPQPRFQEFLQRSDLHAVGTLLGAYLLVDLLIEIIAYWIGSKAVAASDKSTFGNALKLWAYNLIPNAVLAVCAILMLTHQHYLPAFCVSLFFLILMLFVIPMNVYGIGFLRTLGFLVLIVIVRGAGAFVVKKVVLNIPDASWLPHSTQVLTREIITDTSHFGERLAGKNAPDEIDWMLDEALVPIGPTPQLRERQAMVAVLQQKLQARKASFPPGVPPPPAFQKQMDRYTKFLNEVKTEMAQPPVRTASTSS